MGPADGRCLHGTGPQRVARRERRAPVNEPVLRRGACADGGPHRGVRRRLRPGRRLGARRSPQRRGRAPRCMRRDASRSRWTTTWVTRCTKGVHGVIPRGRSTERCDEETDVAGSPAVRMSLFTNVHHIKEWKPDRGPTDLDNLVLLCVHHHGLVHSKQWRMSGNPNELLTFVGPSRPRHGVAAVADVDRRDGSGGDAGGRGPEGRRRLIRRRRRRTPTSAGCPWRHRRASSSWGRRAGRCRCRRSRAASSA